MLSEKELLDILKNYEINVFNTENGYESDNIVTLKTLDELLQFARNQNINSFFYHYGYAKKEAFIIGEDDINEINPPVEDRIHTKLTSCEPVTFNAISKLVEQYNNDLEKYDFDRPILLQLFCIYQGIVFTFFEFDYWFKLEGLDTPEIIAKKMYEDNHEDIIKAKKEAFENYDNLKKELKEQILHDEKFQCCKNNDLRKSYADNFYNTDEKCRKVFRYPGSPVRFFINEIWNDYKNIK